MQGKQTTLADVIWGNTVRIPNALAFIEDGDEHGNDATTRFTWREYHEASNALALLLVERGYRRGERIGIWLPDGIAVHVAFVACEKAGLVAVGIAPRAGEKEIAHVLRVSEAVALVGVPQRNGQPVAALYERVRENNTALRELIAIEDSPCTRVTVAGQTRILPRVGAIPDALQTRRVAAHELFLINSTSGTTGMPKCVAHDQARWLSFTHYARDAAPLSDTDIFLCAVPASVGFGLWFCHFTAAVLGTPTVLLPKFSASALLRALTRHRVTVLAAVSTQLNMLLNAIEANEIHLDELRFLFTGGEAVPFERAVRFEALTAAIVLQFYGSNEAGGLSYTHWRDSQDLRLRTAGRVIPEMQVTLLDPSSGQPTIGIGRPVCKGPLLSRGYVNDAAANARLYTDDGFMKMEDIVRIDARGYLSVVGRIGDFIIRGGKNISAAAVEEAALLHPGIAAAAAVAMPDAVFGERVCLYATPATTTQAMVKPPTLEALVEFLRDSGVSSENCPERLIFLDELPQVSGGKVAKQVLRDDIRRRLAEENG